MTPSTQAPQNPYRQPGLNTAGQIRSPFRPNPVTSGGSAKPGRGGLLRQANTQNETSVTRAAKLRVTKGGRAGTDPRKESNAGGGGQPLKPVRPTFGPITPGDVPHQSVNRR